MPFSRGGFRIDIRLTSCEDLPTARNLLGVLKGIGGQNVIGNIQALRAFAALAVVWHHLQMQLSEQLGTPHLGYHGRAGVDVFFVISGFIMFHTTRAGDRTTREFWIDRITRIVPAYWVMTLVAAGLFWAGVHPGGIKGLSLTDVGEDLFFLPHYRADGDAYPVLDVGWTLNFEMFFYALFGLTFFLKSQARSLAVLTGLFLLGALLIHVKPGLPNPLHFFLQPITLEFAAGGALALLYPHAGRLSQRTLIWGGGAMLAVGVAAILVNGTVWGKDVSWNYELRTLVFGPASMLVVAGAIMLEKGGAVVRSPTMLLLGAGSYAIYLVHLLVVLYLVKLAGFVAPQPPTAVLVIAGGAIFAAATFAGLLFHKLVERPLSAWLRRLMRRRPVAAVA